MTYEFHRPGRLLVEGDYAGTFFEPLEMTQRKKWQETNTFTYQLIIDKSKEDKLYSFFIQDLDRMFGLKAAIEKRPIRCLTLVRTSEKDKLRTKGGEKKDNFTPSDIKSSKYDSTREIMNYPFATFSARLQAFLESSLQVPFIDNTGYANNIDISVSGEALDRSFQLEKMRTELRKYDLDLVWKDFSLDVLVIKN